MIWDVINDTVGITNKIVPIFRDRTEAGERLFEEVAKQACTSNVVGIAYGGIPVALPFWQEHDQQPQVLPISKVLADPADDRFGIGAAVESGVTLNTELINFLGLSEAEVLEGVNKAKIRLLEKTRRLEGYLFPRGDNSLHPLTVVDDGVASGFTMLAGLEILSQTHNKEIVVATPIIDSAARTMIESAGYKVIALHTAQGSGFMVDAYYDHFSDINPDEAKEILDGSL